ncbi:MAG TPA: glutathione transferase GstA [Dongiaceae bacterium]|jgi:glutathione S-transferase
MKLYYAPGACSLSPHIVINELGLKVDVEKADLKSKKTESGGDFLAVNPKGQVPTLVMANGQVLTEGPVIVQYLADQKPEAGLMPPAGSPERYRVQEWLNYITSELHKGYSPLFNPTVPDEYKKIARTNLANKYRFLDKLLAGKSYLMGDKFTVADAYLFTVTNWAGHTNVDLSEFPNVQAFQKRVAERPKVQEVLKAEGLVK